MRWRYQGTSMSMPQVDTSRRAKGTRASTTFASSQTSLTPHFEPLDNGIDERRISPQNSPSRLPATITEYGSREIVVDGRCEGASRYQNGGAKTSRCQISKKFRTPRSSILYNQSTALATP